LAIHTDDTNSDWVVRISHVVETATTPTAADCMLHGSASDLDLFLWNRVGVDALQVEGDESLLDLWRASVTIRWGR
jgi:hypothetical protein